ncbi:MAG: transporter [Vicinamibacteria bacterium]
MLRRLSLLIVLCSVVVLPPAFAQEPFNVAVTPDKLAFLLTELYGPNGLIVDSLTVLPSGDTHSAHFNGGFQSEFTQFNTALASQIVNVPLPSPASGFTYEFDASLGVFERTTQSFGPILAERAQTIGGKRFSFGFTFQHFTFDSIEGLDLDSVPAVYTHDDFQLRGGREDLVTTINSIKATVNQFTTFLTFGVTDRLDVSLAVPVVSNDMTVISDATVRRIGTTDPQVHFFRALDGSLGNRRLFTALGSSTGIGDITLRLKVLAARGSSNGLSLALDLRAPTGDEEDLLGSGAAGARPFLIWSAGGGAFSPHINLGYQWNGKSTLAGNPSTGESGELPDHAFYTVGADFSLGSRFTFAMDLLGQYAIDAPRVAVADFVAQDGQSTFQTLTFYEDSYNSLSGALGFKLNVVENLLIDFNVLFNIDDNGLRDKVTPLAGVEYAF